MKAGLFRPESTATRTGGLRFAPSTLRVRYTAGTLNR